MSLLFLPATSYNHLEMASLYDCIIIKDNVVIFPLPGVPFRTKLENQTVLELGDRETSSLFSFSLFQYQSFITVLLLVGNLSGQMSTFKSSETHAKKQEFLYFIGLQKYICI